MGLILELGSERNMGSHYMAGIRGISAHAHHSWLAWATRCLFRDPWICGSHVHILRRDIFAARIACVRLSFKAQADLLRTAGLEWSGPASKAESLKDWVEQNGTAGVE